MANMLETIEVVILIISVLTIFFLLECLFCAIFCKGKWYRKSNKVRDAEKPETIQVEPYRDENISKILPISNKNESNIFKETEDIQPFIKPIPIPTFKPKVPTLEPKVPTFEPKVDLDERFRTVELALIRTGEGARQARYVGHREKSEDQYDVSLNWQARQRHFVKGPFSISAAENMSRGRGSFAAINTVFEEPEAFDKVHFDVCGPLILTRSRVRTVQCEHGNGTYKGRCYGVFCPFNGHLLFKTSLETAEMRPGTVGVVREAPF